jgi:hypothetical protein
MKGFAERARARSAIAEMPLHNPALSVGLFGIGLDTYWPQFRGLRERLLGYQKQIARKIGGCGVRVVDAGLVDHQAR